MKNERLINLNSFTAQEELRYELLTRFMIRFAVAAFIMLLVPIVFLSTSVLYLESIKGGVASNIEQVERLSRVRESEEAKQRVSAAIAFIRAVAEIAADDFHWSDIVKDIFAVLPPDVRLLDMYGSVAQKNFSMKALVPQREGVLSTKEALEKLPFVARVDYPRTCVIPQNSITCQFSVVLK